MRTLALTLAVLTGACAGPLTQDGDDPMVTARRVLTTTPLVDGHNDLAVSYDLGPNNLRQGMPGHTDIERLRRGMVGAVFFSVWGSYDPVLQPLASLNNIEIVQWSLHQQYGDVFEQAYSAADVERIFGDGRIAAVLALEGGYSIGNSLTTLRAYYRMGVRYITLTHNSHTDWADSHSGESQHGGLTEFGKTVVREMNWLGMLVDLSHTSVETVHDALDVSEAPVIFSHSSTYTLTDATRNVPDDVLRRLPENGGVVMVTFVGGFVNQGVRDYLRNNGDLSENEQAEALRNAPRATLGDVADHIEHVREVAGINHVGIGSDFDGTPLTPIGLDDVSTFPALFAELARRGWTEEELAKLAGENVLRAWREAERVASRLQRERRPSTVTIEELER